jgi:hypothetical protein
MKPPILIDGQGDIEVFTTIDEAQRAVEWIDAENGTVVGYDSEGRLLRAVEVPRRFLTSKVRLEAAEVQPCHEAHVRMLLIRLLKSLDCQGISETDSLDVLFAKVLRR